MIRLFICFIVFLFFSCGNKDVPDNVLSPDKMQQVMWDVLRADELASFQYSIDSSVDLKQKSVDLYGRILSIHKVSEKDFKNSFSYYQKNPEKLKPILDSLRNRSLPILPKTLKPL